MRDKDLKNVLEHIKCTICNSKKYKIKIFSKYTKLKNKKELINLYKSSSENKVIDQVVRCNQCKLEYLNPRVKEKIITKSYKYVVDKSHLTQNIFRIKTFYNCLKKIQKKLNIKNLDNKLGLDVGSASGSFLYAAKQLGFKCKGIEPSIWLTNYGKKKYKVDLHQGTLDTFKFKSKFDIIFFWDVLEHLSNLNGALKKVKKISKKNGLLIINVPDKNSFVARIFGRRWPFYLNVHLYNFDEKSITRLLNKYNFKLIKQYPHFQILSLGYVIQRASNYNVLFVYLYKILNILGLVNIPFKYNLGQTTFIFKNK